MGVRLVKHGVAADSGTYDHNKLENRDLPNQHSISSITGLQEALDNIKINIEDTESIDLEYTKSNIGNVLKAFVKVFDSESNAIQVKRTGLFVDKYPDMETENTKIIQLYQEGKGETLLQMYNNGNVFSHNGGTTNIANASEAEAWYFDTNLNSFVQPKNTGTFTGFVSNIKYKTYTHRATLCSTDSDNDANGLVVAYVKDDNGNPHTLSCIINKGGESHAGNWRYALVYNRALSGEQLIKTGNMSSGHTTGGWNGNFITMEITKASNAVECSISDWGSYNINNNTVINIDLDDYSWGYLFKDDVQYGYCNQSQANSYFTDIYFNGKGPLKADIVLSPDVDNRLEIRDNGLYCSDSDISAHEALNVINKSGVHGLRYYDKKLQYYDNGWNDITTDSETIITTDKDIIISPTENNALIKYSNGYYVPGFLISSQINNALVEYSDGYYVPAIPANNATTDDIDIAIDKVNEQLIKQNYLFNERYDVITQKILEFGANTTKSQVHEYNGDNQIDYNSVIDITTLYNLTSNTILNLELMIVNKSDVDTLGVQIIENNIKTLDVVLTKSEVQRYKLPNIPNIEIFIKGTYQLFLYVTYI